MSWFSLIIALVKVVGVFADYLAQKKALDDAKKLVLAEELAAVAKKAGIIRQAAEAVDKLSDTDVDRRLSERGDYRD